MKNRIVALMGALLFTAGSAVCASTYASSGAASTLVTAPKPQGVQTIVRGVVLDSQTQQGEIGAVIEFYQGDSSNPLAYSVTDSLGRFSRAFSQGGSYSLHISNMGRKDIRIEFNIVEGEQTVDLGTILIEDDIEVLKSAQVQAMKTLVKLDVDKLTYKISDDPDSRSKSVLDMLRKVPMVVVDGQDNIKVNGSSSFKVYVDGKPNQMISANPGQILKLMPASTVKDIEVITNPGAKYDAEGVGGVLNLITGLSADASSTIADGVYGTVSVGATTMGGVDGDLYFNAKKNKFTVGAYLSIGTQSIKGITQDDLRTQIPTGVNTTSHSEIDNRVDYTFASVNASYEISSSDLLTADLGFSDISQKSLGNSIISMDGPAAFSAQQDFNQKITMTGYNGSIDYQHNFKDTPGRMFTLSYMFSQDPTHRNVLNDYEGDALQTRQSIGRDISREHTWQADFTTPLGDKHKLSTGLKYILRHNSADDAYYMGTGTGELIHSPEHSMLYDHYNNIGAAYAEYRGTFGRFAATAGVRYEHTWQKVKYGEGYGHDFDAHFGDLVPNASIQYNISQSQNVGLTYNKRISRPGISYLNPYVDRTALTSITYGNGSITSATNHVLGAVYNYFTPKWVVSVMVRHSTCTDGISSYSFYDEQGLLNTTYGNVLSSRSTALQGYINWTAGPKTRVYANFDLSYNDFRSDKIAQTNYGWSHNIMLGLQQTLPKDIMMSLMCLNSSRSYSLQGYSTGLTGVMIDLSKGFFDDRFKVNLSGVTPLGHGLKMVQESHTHGADYSSQQTSTLPFGVVKLTLQYSFGKNNFSVKKAERTIHNDDLINIKSDSGSKTKEGLK